LSAVAFSTSMLRHGARSVKSGGLPFFFATLMTALGAFSLGAWMTLLVNFQRVASTVGESVAAVAFLDVRSAAEAEEIRAALVLDPRVRAATLVSPEEALARARRGLGDAGRALEGSAGLKMPWVIEVTPRFDPTLADLGLPHGDVEARTDERDALLAALRATPGVDEVMHPGGEVKRVDALMRLLHGAGAFLGLLIGLVVIVVVSNAVKITVFQRRDEIAIMKLVGATDVFVRVPFLLSGLVQGTLGSLIGLGALAVTHASLAGVVRVALSGALGTFVLDPMPTAMGVLLLVGGAGLGVVGAALSVGRFLRV
jgi:cell division transport system permease protein